jgi:predicted naringenin-chalcone synthase
MTTPLVPSIDVQLINLLGLRPTVRRVCSTQAGCAGGAYSLVRAFEQHQAYPASVVLVVCVDLLSFFFDPDDIRPHMTIFKALLGDAAGACLVLNDDRPGPILTRTLEYVLPASIQYAGTEVRDEGFYFFTNREFLNAVQHCAPAIQSWMNGLTPDFLFTHCGGPRILRDLEKILTLPQEMFTHAWDSLRTIGNCGSVSVLDCLNRLFTDPPPNEATGVFFGFGPGFTVAAGQVTWNS